MENDKETDKNSNIKLKTMTYYIKNKMHQKILNTMTTNSRIIYNKTLFGYNVFKYYEDMIFEELYKKISINKNIHILQCISDIFSTKLNFYSNNYKLIKENNKIIYEYIKNNYKNHIITNFNYEKTKNEIIEYIINNKSIEFNKDNKQLVFLDIVDKIVLSFYNKIYYTTLNEMLYHKPFTYKLSQEYLDEIKNGKHFVYKNIINTKKITKKDVIKTKQNMSNNIDKSNDNINIITESYKDKIKKLGIKLNEQYIIRAIVYNNLGNHKKILPANVITDLIDKIYCNFKSYYALRSKKIKANKPKYLKETDKFILQFYQASFKINKSKIRLTVGDYITNNIMDILKNDKIEIFNKKYYYKNNIINKKRNKDYIKIAQDKYIHKTNLYDPYYLNINLPNKVKTKKIKLIEIKPVYNKYYKICIIYESTKEIKEPYKLEEKTIKELENDSISIDLGMRNLMTIYNPSGEQKIIKGGTLIYINEKYKNVISKLQEKNKKEKNLNIFNRLYEIIIERDNKINGIINKIIETIIKTYNDKKLFIIGYNEQWKQNLNLGTNTNRKFYQIPYKRILDKLETKLKEEGKEIIITEESYTSKCDALSLEKICKKNEYKGCRLKRGLYSSNVGKLINADLNGAINIMRKVINLTEIKGIGICNPKILKIT